MKKIIVIILATVGSVLGMNINLLNRSCTIEILNKEKKKSEPTIAIISVDNGQIQFIKIQKGTISDWSELSPYMEKISNKNHIYINDCTIKNIPQISKNFKCLSKLEIDWCIINAIDNNFSFGIPHITIVNNKLSLQAGLTLSGITKKEGVTILNNTHVEENNTNK